MAGHRAMIRTPLASGCAILPPHLVTAIAENGNQRQRARALRTLGYDFSLRAARIGSSSLLAPRRRARQLRRAGANAWWQGAKTPALAERTIYTANNRQRLPGTVARQEGQQETGDAATDEAYDNIGLTADFYTEVYGRDSIDDAGMPLSGTVHYGEDYDNAFWNSNLMVYGDGDGDLFNRFTTALDVTGHEMTHGVIEHEAGLIYWGQSGALNESIADVFGSLVKQAANDEKAEDADWLIGEGLFTDEVDGTALRSMEAPGTAYDDRVLGRDPQPADMAHYVNTLDDNGGVHINSGIPNRAFYLVATSLGGYAWESAGRIWYDTLRHPQLKPVCRFRDFARLTTEVARDLYGGSSDEIAAVTDAWRTVGIRS
jgi:Zn-dependent metalloprotease